MTAKILSHGGIKISRSPLHNTKAPVSIFPKSWHIPHPIFKGTLEKWFMNKGHKLLPVQPWSSAASCQRTAHVSFSTGQPCNAWCNSLHQDLSFPPTRRWGQNPWVALPSSFVGTSISEALQWHISGLTSAEPACKASHVFKELHLLPAFSSVSTLVIL